MNNSFSCFASYLISKFFIGSKANTFTHLKFITTNNTIVLIKCRHITVSCKSLFTVNQI